MGVVISDLTEASVSHWSPELFELGGKFWERRQAWREAGWGRKREMNEREEREERNLHVSLSYWDC